MSTKQTHLLWSEELSSWTSKPFHLQVCLKEKSFEVKMNTNLTAVDSFGRPLHGPNGLNFSVVSSSSVRVVCDPNKDSCRVNTLLLYPQTIHKNYLIQINFELNKSNDSLVNGIVFEMLMQNSPFTKFLLIFRYLCLCASVINLLVYIVFCYCKATVETVMF